MIVVDARTDPKTDIDKNPGSPGLGTLIDIISSVPMSNYSFDTVQQLLNAFEDWHRDKATYTACEAILKNQCPAGKMPAPAPFIPDAYAIYIGFDQIKDERERRDFLNLPTTFALPTEDVDKLRKIGPMILDESEAYKKLCAELRCQK